MNLVYDESYAKPVLRPRHPVVCILDIAGVMITLIFLFQSTNLYNQLYISSIVMMYCASTLHHWMQYNDLNRRLDHIMIFIVIAMSAMPFWGIIMPFSWHPLGIIIIGTIIVAGTVTKLINFCPKIISALMYLVAGLPMTLDFIWNIDFIPYPYNILWLVGVGIYFKLLLVYTFQWYNFIPNKFGFHEVMHILLVIATSLHSSIAILLVE